MNRRGISEVVANVLIVLLVITGIAVIWSVVKPTIDDGTTHQDPPFEVITCLQDIAKAQCNEMNMTDAQEIMGFPNNPFKFKCNGEFDRRTGLNSTEFYFTPEEMSWCENGKS